MNISRKISFGKLQPTKPNRLIFLVISMAIAVSTAGIGLASAESGKSERQLPRFASLKSKRVNMRVGPGSDYQVLWMYVKQGLPIEIIQEFGNWRKIRDPQGNEGWVLHSLLSHKRTAIVSPWDKGKNDQLIAMHGEPEDEASLMAKLEPGVVAKVSYCENQWCKLTAADAHGYVKQDLLWGVYPNEDIDN